MAQRHKFQSPCHPISTKDVEAAAAELGMTVSVWLAATAAHQLRLEAGRRGIVEWEAEHGALIAEELVEGLARARTLLGRTQN